MKDKNIENKTSASSENLRGTPQSAVRTEKPLTVRKNWLRTLGIILCAAALTLGIVFGVGNIFKTEDDFKIYAANEQAAADWVKAVGDSLADSTGATYTVRLEADWGAEGESFGSGTGYTNGALYIPAGAKIELDLNGHTLSRNLSTSKSNGYVINVAGQFTLKDTSGTQLGMVTGGYNATVSSGGGVFVNNGGVFNFIGGNVANNTNSASDNTGAGGVFIGQNSTLNMYEGAKISGNSGTGLSCMNNSHITISGGTVTGNSSRRYAGGIVFSYTSANVSNLTVSNNVLLSTSTESWHVAGIYATKSTINMTNCTITGNVSQATNNADDAGAIWIYNYSNLTLDNCYIAENTSVKGVGGILTKSTLLIKNCVVSANQGVYGGLFYHQNNHDVNEYIQNCTIQDNIGTKAGAIYGAMSAAVPQRAVPYSMFWRNFLAFLAL